MLGNFIKFFSYDFRTVLKRMTNDKKSVKVTDKVADDIQSGSILLILSFLLVTIIIFCLGVSKFIELTEWMIKDNIVGTAVGTVFNDSFLSILKQTGPLLIVPATFLITTGVGRKRSQNNQLYLVLVFLLFLNLIWSGFNMWTIILDFKLSVITISTAAVYFLIVIFASIDILVGIFNYGLREEIVGAQEEPEVNEETEAINYVAETPKEEKLITDDILKEPFEFEKENNEFQDVSFVKEELDNNPKFSSEELNALLDIVDSVEEPRVVDKPQVEIPIFIEDPNDVVSVKKDDFEKIEEPIVVDEEPQRQVPIFTSDSDDISMINHINDIPEVKESMGTEIPIFTADPSDVVSEVADDVPEKQPIDDITREPFVKRVTGEKMFKVCPNCGVKVKGEYTKCVLCDADIK